MRTVRPFVADYGSYYLRQAEQRGGSIPYFAGARYQRGHGLGNIFSALRSVLPSVAKNVGRLAVQTGVNIANDWLAGKKLKESIGNRAFRGAVGVAREIIPRVIEAASQSKKQQQQQPAETIKKNETEQSGSGKKRKRRQKVNRKIIIKKKKRGCKKDIFD